MGFNQIPMVARFFIPGLIWSCVLMWGGVGGTATATAEELRVFTDKSGRTLKAEFVSFKDDQVTMKREDGQVFTLSADTFSAEDNLYFRQKVNAQTGSEVKASGRPEAPPNSVVIEALIDGPSELRVKKDGIYWINGGNAKPGRHQGQEEPTYVDGKPWRPNWKNSRANNGVDRTATKSVDGIDPKEIGFQLLSVSISREAVGIEQRDKIQVNSIGEELSILIPDSQGGSRWYRFALVKKP